MEQDEWWTVVIQFCGIQGSKTLHLDWNSKGIAYIVKNFPLNFVLYN